MNLEIHRPELVQRVNEQIQSRRLHDADELLEQALDALDEKSPRRHRQRNGGVWRGAKASWRCSHRYAA